MANYDVYLQAVSTDADNENSGGNILGVIAVGNSVISSSNDGAARFPGVQVNQGVTVNAAQLRLYAQLQGSGNMHLQTYGIKQTNTAAFDSSTFSRPRTTAVTTTTNGMPGVGAFIGLDVTSQVNEVVGQGGWASGNAMGFLIFNSGSDTGAKIEDDGLHAQLVIQVSAPGNFTPAPGTVTVGSLPAATDWGMKVSQPGVDVKTATESQLYFTSRKKELRVGTELAVAGTTSQYTHGMGYAPSTLGYYINSGTCKIMNFPSNISSVEEYIASDGTNINYFLAGTAESGYIYVFIDPLT